MERKASETSYKSKSNVSHGAQRILDELQAEQSRKDEEFSAMSSEMHHDHIEGQTENDHESDSEGEEINPADVIIKQSDLIY